MKYAVMVWFEDDWMYVTQGSGFNVLTFDNSIDAEDLAESWRLTGREEYVKVVPYESQD